MCRFSRILNIVLLLAMDTEQMGEAGLAAERLANLMQNCVACHAGYRLTTELP